MTVNVEEMISSNERNRLAVADEEDDDESHILEHVYTATLSAAKKEEYADPFSQKASEIKGLGGLTPTFKRNVTRQLNKTFDGTGGAKSKALEPIDVTAYNLFRVVFPPYNLDYLAKIVELNSAHAAAIKAKVANIVGLGFDFVESPTTKNIFNATEDQKKKAKLSRKINEGRQTMHDWIDSCNSEDTFTETLIKVWVDYESTGNGYIEVGRTATGAVAYIGHVQATTVRVRQDRDGFVQIVNEKAVFFRNFGDTKTVDPIGGDRRPNELIHLKKYTPTGNFYGVPDIIPALQAVAASEFIARYNLDYFENKAVPRYVIIIKGSRLSVTAQTEVAEFFETSLKGKNHRSLVVPLPPDEPDRKSEFSMQPVEAGKQEGSFENLKDASRDEIFMAHRVPLTKAGVATDAAGLAAAKDFDKTFKEQVCRPDQDILEKKLNRIIKEKTDVYLLALNELSLTDEETQAKIDDTNLKNKTLMPNEARVKRGQPGYADGDKPLELKPQQAAEATSQAGQTRTRDQARTANATDSKGAARNPKGDGRTTA